MGDEPEVCDERRQPRPVLAVALLLAWSGAACHGDRVQAQPDGGDAAIDARDDAGTVGRLPTCKTERILCVGQEVHACDGDEPGSLLETCNGPKRCNLGRCTSQECVLAERSGGLVGCLFYGVQTDNDDGDDGRKLMLAIGNTGDNDTRVVVSTRETGAGWVEVASEMVPGGGTARLQITRPVGHPGVTEGGGFRVESQLPVMVTQIVADDTDRMSRSSGGTVLRPRQALGNGHLAIAFAAHDTAEVARTPGSRGGAGAISIVATSDGTEVRVKLAAPTWVDGSTILDKTSPEHRVVLQEGDVLQMFAATPAGDLTGTAIQSTAPVAVFTGNVFTTYGYVATGFNGGDLAVEQLPPTASWGREYAGAWLSPQKGCDPFFGPATGLWRVVAAEDNTTVTLSPAPGVTLDLPSLTFRLGRGQSLQFLARGRPGVQTGGAVAVAGDFVARANLPILLGQWLDCEPGLALGMDLRLGSGPLTFVLPPAFENDIVLVRRKGAHLTFDDRDMASERFAPMELSTGTMLEVTRLLPSEIGPCADLIDPCRHRIDGEDYAMTWRGMDVVCSYALTVPTSNPCALPGAEPTCRVE
jgi:hypothetical protein